MPNFKVDRLVYDVVNIVPHDISPDKLYKLVKSLNKELNSKAIASNPDLQNHYDLIKNKNIDDGKYTLIVKKDLGGSIVPQ